MAFNDDDDRQRFEANTRETQARISALKKLKAAGVKTAALVCPVIPYITNVKLLIDNLAEHADRIWIYGLSIQNRSDSKWQNFEKILESHFPDLKRAIQSAVFSKTHSYWGQLRRDLSRLKTDIKLNLSIHV